MKLMLPAVYLMPDFTLSAQLAACFYMNMALMTGPAMILI
jgi:hypothetical protein